MKPLGLRFLGVVVSTLFVVFAISVLSHSPDDIPIATVSTDSKVDSGVDSTSSISVAPDVSSAVSSNINNNYPPTSPVASSSVAPSLVSPSPIFSTYAQTTPQLNPPAATKLNTNPPIANNAANIKSTQNQNYKPAEDDDDTENENLNTTQNLNNTQKNIKNLCGPVGAILSAVAVNLFGQSALFLLLPFGACAIKLLTMQKFDQIILRSIGFIFALIGSCGLCGLFAHKLIAFPLSTNNPGGFIGLSVATAINNNVAVVGSVVLLLSLIIGGLVLSADGMLLQLTKLLIALLNNAASGKPQHNPTPDLPSPTSPTSPSTSTLSTLPNRHHAAHAAHAAHARPVVIANNQTPEHNNNNINITAIKHGNTNAAINNAQIINAKQTAAHNDRQSEIQSNTIKKIETAKNLKHNYKLPTIELLTQPEVYNDNDCAEESEQRAIQIENVFKTFNLQVEVVDVQRGPTVSQFELQLAKGLRINKIQQLADDLGLALRVPKVRVVNPIPGKNTLGVELPNKIRRIVRMREIIEQSSDSWQSLNIPLFLGKDVSGKPMISDLAALTHLLIAGRTGTGKSVCLNSIIVSILMTRTPEEVRMLMIDPKSVELSPYQNIPHLIHPVVIDMSKTEAILSWVVEKMQERYRLLNAARVVHINDYNKLPESELRRRMELTECSDEEWQIVPKSLPRIVIIIDEFGELMSSVAPKEIEGHIIRLAQKSRAVGIHLVLATQKPTVDVITGLIKSNLPTRISFGVATRGDSMVILDQTGAERLLGRGDMLFLNSDKNEINRGQGTFVDRDDIDKIVNEIKTDKPDFIDELVEVENDEIDATDNYGNNAGGFIAKTKRKDTTNITNIVDEQHDDLYEKAVEYVIGEGRGSTSLLQRKLSIGYGRAAKIIETMEAEGIVGPYNGSQAREVIMTLNEWYKSLKNNNTTKSFQINNNIANANQRTTPKILSELLASGKTKMLHKNAAKQSENVNRNIQVSPENNCADNYVDEYCDDNSYFDPTYDNNNNSNDNYNDDFDFAS
ncbi:MAG: DNA translocase FtsK 4TM domain-containing protein [Planctomycetaceae bacterium]|jgi:S-DNA-T family DNA segregation ATPase FtsK/SpoIIIE|nr:DNA translocase FtsK 4TM domain-containing protein [Planctomycetaceae bacterium]